MGPFLLDCYELRRPQCRKEPREVSVFIGGSQVFSLHGVQVTFAWKGPLSLFATAWVGPRKAETASEFEVKDGKHTDFVLWLEVT